MMLIFCMILIRKEIFPFIIPPMIDELPTSGSHKLDHIYLWENIWASLGNSTCKVKCNEVSNQERRKYKSIWHMWWPFIFSMFFVILQGKCCVLYKYEINYIKNWDFLVSKHCVNRLTYVAQRNRLHKKEDLITQDR